MRIISPHANSSISCSEEEKEKSEGKLDTYVLEGYGHLPYAGFGGNIYSDFINVDHLTQYKFNKLGMLNQIRAAQRTNDLGTKLFDNLRKGDWLLDYILQRLKGHENLAPLTEWLTTYFNYLRIIPRHLIPRYFSRIFNILRHLIEMKTLEKLKPITDSLKVMIMMLTAFITMNNVAILAFQKTNPGFLPNGC